MEIIYKTTKSIKCGFGGQRIVDCLATNYFVCTGRTNLEEAICLVDGTCVKKKDVVGIIPERKDKKITVYSQRQLKNIVEKKTICTIRPIF